MSGGAQDNYFFLVLTKTGTAMAVPAVMDATALSGVVSDISCRMGWGLRRKECHIYILHPGLSFLTT